MAEESGGAADERLIIMLEARIKDFEKQMLAAERRGTRTFRMMQQESRSNTDRMQQALANAAVGIGHFSKAFIGGLAGGAITGAFAMMTSNLARTVRGIAEIGDEAKRAGLAVDAFQEWKFVAEQNRIGVDSLVDGFKELSLRADEFTQTGGGSAAEAFQRLGLGAADLKDKLKDPSELMLEIMGRMEGLDKAAQIRIADEVFGGSGGERFVELLSQGEAGLRQTIDRAHEVGAVMDAEMIQKSAELDRRWQALTTTTGNWFKGVAVGVADTVAQITGLTDALDGILADEGRARTILGNEIYERLQQSKFVVQEQRDMLAEIGELNERTIPQVQAMGEALGRISDSLSQSHPELAQDLSSISGNMQALSYQFQNGMIEADEFHGKMGDLIAETRVAFGELAKIDSVGFGTVFNGLEVLAGMLGVVAQKGREARASMSLGQTMPPPGGALSGSVDGLMPPDPSVTLTSSPRPPPRQGVDTYGNWEDAATGSGRSTGGAGGGTGRLESLVSDLQTEREVLEIWYQEGLDLLNGATDAQLEAIGGKHEAIERLELEHRDRMRGIEDAGRAMSLEGVLGAGADIIGALGATNKKALKVSQGFAAAEAWISTLRGAAKELEKGVFGFGSAAAVIAKGAAFVAAIKGTSEGSTAGASSGGGGSSTTVASAQSAAPQAVILDLQSLDPAMKALAQALAVPMIAQLQKASKTGVNIVGIRV